MIKELKDISNQEISNLLDERITLIEKIDAPYFIVEFKNGEISIKKSNHEELTNVDMILNSMYKKISDFGNSLKNLPFNLAHIGFWYFPTEKPMSISYPKYAHKFMLSDYNGLKEEDLNLLYNIGVLPQPIIKELIVDEKFRNSIKKLASGIYSNEYFVVSSLKSIKYKGTPFMDMEGIILKTPKKSYQIILNKKELSDTHIQQKKMYRDIILKDFINWYSENIPYIEKSNYLNIVYNLFTQYINWTEVINKYSIEKDDLIPPYSGYIGDLSYDLITDNNVNYVCRNNFVYKGILKILLNSLRKPLKKFDGDLLKTDDVEIFNSLVEKIKESI